MAIGVHHSEKSRHLVLRVSAGETIPDALTTALRTERVTCGWLRASGVLADVELRAYGADIGALGSARRIEGPTQVLILEGCIGLSDGDPSLSMRALLARESDCGLETMAGEIGSARAVALEVFVTALDDLTLHRELDEAAGVWLLGVATGQVPAHGARERPVTRPAWSAALEASERADRVPPERPALASRGHPAVIPARPRRPVPVAEVDAPFPEAGDFVDHFTFGRCNVLKSDGDRLHLKVHKDGRVREIALDMLRVSRLPDGEDGQRRFKLERRM